MKKIIKIRSLSALLLIAALLCSINTVCAVGTTGEAQAAVPRYVILGSITTDLTIQSTSMAGCASCSANAIAARGYKISIVAELQQNNGRWETITSWSASGTTNVSIPVNSSYYVASGYDYQVKVTAKVYDSADKLIETGTEYSPVVSY